MEILLEIALLGLLAVTLFHAVRLQRALGVLKRDRVALAELVSGFNASTSQAEAGIDRLRAAADGVGRQMARQLDEARTLKDDLAFLAERGGELADRLDGLVRAGRSLVLDPPRPLRAAPAVNDEAPPRSQAERDLLKALRMAR
jgi:hypothetical protein